MNEISYPVIMYEDPLQSLGQLVKEEGGRSQAEGEALVQVPVIVPEDVKEVPV